ncbi:helix-turn-helix transcriptional regulator [Rodentibacter ratti]|uniref:helix-turn-helix transcriptional regulator n=1 Tax=Rodentibacter ratti TaxID=1906745 RepID=UPI0021173FE7|nr:AlpA family transcriptional regulator [Rodentibacter ratti]
MQQGNQAKNGLTALTRWLMDTRHYPIRQMMTDNTQKERFLRVDDVINLTGLSRSTIYDKTRLGKFPEAVNLGGNAKAWLESEVRAWMNARIEQRNNKAKQAGKK